jgi:hypothetical protein
MQNDDEEISNETPSPADEPSVADSNAPKTWEKGGPSPNPKGRTKQPKTSAEVRAIAREHTVGAIETLVKVHKNPKAPFPARVAAAEAILSRGWGRPSGDFEGGEALVIKVVKFAEQQLEDTEIKTIEHIPNADDQSPV